MLREGRFLLLSVGAHALLVSAALVLLALHWFTASPPSTAVFPRDVMEVDISAAPRPLDLPRVEMPMPAPPTPSEDAQDPRVGANDQRAPQRGDRPPGEAPSAESPPSNTPPSNGPPPDEYSPVPNNNGVLTVPGLDGKPVWAMPGMLPDAPRSAPAPTTTPRAREVDKDIAGQVMRQAMKEKDKARGIELPAAGTAASAVQASLYGSDLPTEARGTIAIQIGPGGKVTGVKVLSMVGGSSDQWERAAQAAAARLRAQKLDLPDEYKNGATVYIDAVSVEQSPAGKGSGFSGGTAKFDLSNIGAHKRQVVRVTTRVVAIR